jgi:LPP20 lipoprotein
LNNKLLLILTLLFSGCATVDKALVPVDNLVNDTESTYQKASHSMNETMNNIGNSAASLKSDFFENSLIKFFSSDETISKNREDSYVLWKSASTYNANNILSDSLKETDIKNPDTLKTSQKMKILKDYFFQVLKDKHSKKFSSKYKKPEFDEFLTDRENINKIHEYKIALADAEHEWKISLNNTKKQVAQLMLSTLYAEPTLKYVSYDPYDEEMFISVESTNKGFIEKIKIEANREIAREIKTGITNIKPFIFFKFNEDVLEFVGINIKHNKKPYICDIVDNTYVRQSDVVFTSDDISLNSLDVQYYNVVKNIKPPAWFNNIKSKDNQTIGFGEGINKDDAKKEAYKDIAMSIKTTVSANFESEKTVSGSTYSNSFKSKSNQKIEDIDIKGAKVLKTEKKDGLWFVAVLHNQ